MNTTDHRNRRTLHVDIGQNNKIISHVLSPEDFVIAARGFLHLSKKCLDTWKIYEDTEEIHKTYLKKEEYVNKKSLFKTEYVIYYNLSYGVPTFSFNVWNCEGILLNLEQIREFLLVKFEKDFYSVVTQQEHPIFHRPYFVIHPCHTESLLVEFKNQSKNIIVTFLGLITPLINLNLDLEYGL